MSQVKYNPPYAHIPVPDAPEGVNRALDQIARNVQEVINAPVVPTLSRPPQRLVTGMIVFADGVGWDPGFGRGVYGYDGEFLLDAVSSDGTLIGTIPNWTPSGVYLVRFLFSYAGNTPPVPQAILGNLLTGNNACYIRLDGDRHLVAQHASGAVGQIGNIRSLQPLEADTVYVVAFAVTSEGRISLTVNDLTASATFNYGGPPAGFSQIFNDSASGVADGTIAIGRLVMNGLDDGQIRRYLFEDELTGTIADTGAPGGEDGTWNGIGAGNVIEIKGGWIPLFTYLG